MRSISEAAARVSNETLGRKFVALGRIASHWEDIVGKSLADKAVPAKIHYHKYKNGAKNKKPEAILEIATSSAHATKLHYQKDLILERINQIFGERWIADIKFVNVMGEIKRPPMQKKTALSTEEKKDLSKMLDLVDDPDIKEMLDRLGSSILQEAKNK